MAIIIFEYLRRKKQARCPLLRCGAFFALTGFFSLHSASAAFPNFPNFANASRDRAQGDTLYQQAYSAYHEGDYAQAQRLAEQADKLSPDQADGWNLRGVVLLKQKMYDQAEAAFSHSLTCDPNFWAAEFNQAEVPYQRKDYTRARARFEHLLAQTDRYKDKRKWEMVLYKTFLSYLFSGDEAGARKKLAKLGAAPGTDPVLVYADAAVAFHRKDSVGAQKMLAAAQVKFPQETNDLFSEPLVQAGWITVLPPVPGLPPGNPGLLPVKGGVSPALGAANGVLATPGGVYNNHQPIVIDPKVEAAAAEPLPEQGGSIKPMLTKVSGVKGSPALPSPPLPAGPAVKPSSAPAPAGTPTVAVNHPPTEARPDTSLEHGGLLLE